MRVLFFNMNEDLELKNFFIQSIEKKFKDDDINFNDVEIYKSPYHYRVSCTLMFDYTTNTNSLFFSQKLSIYEKFPFETIITLKEYNNYLRNKKLKIINNENN